MARNNHAAHDLRHMWEENMAPLMVAAREGANHAVRTAHRERMRARIRSRWARRRWLLAAGAGIALAGIIGIAGSITAARARQEATGPRPGNGDYPMAADAGHATRRQPSATAPSATASPPGSSR